MSPDKRNPAPLTGGDRESELIEAAKLDGSEDNLSPCNPQALTAPPGFNPSAMPIIAAHFFGIGSEIGRAA